MAALRRWWARLVATVRSDTREADLAREITAHLDLLQDRFIGEGVPPEQARAAARRAMGGVELTKELHRDARAFRWLDDATQDARYAIRIGATPASVRRSIVWQGLLLCGGGVACGLVGAAGLAGYLQSLLFEVGPLDPVTLAAASLLLIAVGALAAYLPAREATSIDPLTAIRCD